MDEMALTLNSPITDEQWDMITDVDFDNTDNIIFYTKHGKEVKFVKSKTGRWIPVDDSGAAHFYKCSRCGYLVMGSGRKYCEDCGAKMEVEHDCNLHAE